jgi:hypothetical protein
MFNNSQDERKKALTPNISSCCTTPQKNQNKV